MANIQTEDANGINWADLTAKTTDMSSDEEKKYINIFNDAIVQKEKKIAVDINDQNDFVIQPVEEDEKVQQ